MYIYIYICLYIYTYVAGSWTHIVRARTHAATASWLTSWHKPSISQSFSFNNDIPIRNFFRT